MGQAKQRKAEIEALKAATADFIKTNDFKVKPENFQGGANLNTGKFLIEKDSFGMFKFDIYTEANKMMGTVLNDPSPEPVYSNSTDLQSLKFSYNDTGWFIAILPAIIVKNKNTQEISLNFLIKEEHKHRPAGIMAKLPTKWFLGEHHYAVGVQCNWNTARQLYEDVRKTFEYALIGFSTPHNLQILSENPNYYGDNMVTVTI